MYDSTSTNTIFTASLKEQPKIMGTINLVTQKGWD